MKHNMKLFFLSLIILTLSACARSNSTFTEANVKAINKEISDSFFQGDLSVLEKYLYEGTEFFIDLDPNPNSGEKQITLKEYRQMMKLALMVIDDIKIKEEIVEIEIDEKKDQARLKVNVHVSSDIMGIKTKEQSIGTTTFGVINGEIKILKIKDQLISIETE